MANLGKRLDYISHNGETYCVGFSTNDLTDELKAKLDSMAQGAQVNVIEHITFEGEELNTDTETKTVSLSSLQRKLVPGAGIGLDNEGNIRITYDHTAWIIVSALPASPAEGNEHRIHIVPSQKAETGNAYKEYIWLPDDGKWEEFGDFHAAVDLADYYKRQEADDKFVAKEEGKALSANDFTDLLKAKLDGISTQANRTTFAFDVETATLNITTE